MRVSFWVPKRDGNKEANKAKWASNHIPAFPISSLPTRILDRQFYVVTWCLKLTHSQPISISIIHNLICFFLKNNICYT